MSLKNIFPVLPKVPIELKDSLSAHNKEGAISPETKVYVGRGTDPEYRAVNGAYYFQSVLVCPFKGGCAASLSATSPSNQKETHECSKCIIEHEMTDYKFKETITFKEKPDSNRFSFKVDTNLIPEFDGVCGREEQGFRSVRWHVPLAIDPMFTSDPLMAYASNVGGFRGSIYYIEYQNGLLVCEFKETFLDRAIFPVVIV